MTRCYHCGGKALYRVRNRAYCQERRREAKLAALAQVLERDHGRTEKEHFEKMMTARDNKTRRWHDRVLNGRTAHSEVPR